MSKEGTEVKEGTVDEQGTEGWERTEGGGGNGGNGGDAGAAAPVTGAAADEYKLIVALGCKAQPANCANRPSAESRCVV